MLILSTNNNERKDSLYEKEDLSISFEIFPPFEDDEDEDEDKDDEIITIFNDYKKQLNSFEKVKLSIIPIGIQLLFTNNGYSLLIPNSSLTFHSTLSDNENEDNGVLLLQVDSSSFEYNGNKIEMGNLMEDGEEEDIIYHIYITGPNSLFKEAEELYEAISEKIEMPNNAIINN